MTIAQNPRNLIDGFREHDDQRQRAMCRQTVALEHTHRIDRIDNAFAGHYAAQVRDDLLTLLHDGRVRLRHYESAHILLHHLCGQSALHTIFVKW